MERKLIVSLLQKNIEELAMITEGFMEMKEYPAAIIQLARRKTEDVLDYIRQLEAIKAQELPQMPVIEEEPETQAEELPAEAPEEEEPLEEPEAALEAPEEDFDTEDITEESLPEEMLQSQVEAPEDVFEEEAEGQQEASTAEEEQPVKPTLLTEVQRHAAVLPNKTDTTIAGVHTLKKIDDIRQAISIGDRFRFQRELFSGNGELMNKTLSKLNGMNSFDEANDYLHSKFKWNDEDETVENFYQIVKRRY